MFEQLCDTDADYPVRRTIYAKEDKTTSSGAVSQNVTREADGNTGRKNLRPRRDGKALTNLDVTKKTKPLENVKVDEIREKGNTGATSTKIEFDTLYMTSESNLYEKEKKRNNSATIQNVRIEGIKETVFRDMYDTDQATTKRKNSRRQNKPKKRKRHTRQISKPFITQDDIVVSDEESKVNGKSMFQATSVEREMGGSKNKPTPADPYMAFDNLTDTQPNTEFDSSQTRDGIDNAKNINNKKVKEEEDKEQQRKDELQDLQYIYFQEQIPPYFPEVPEETVMDLVDFINKRKEKAENLHSNRMYLFLYSVAGFLEYREVADILSKIDGFSKSVKSAVPLHLQAIQEATKKLNDWVTKYYINMKSVPDGIGTDTNTRKRSYSAPSTPSTTESYSTPFQPPYTGTTDLNTQSPGSACYDTKHLRYAGALNTNPSTSLPQHDQFVVHYPFVPGNQEHFRRYIAHKGGRRMASALVIDESGITINPVMMRVNILQQVIDNQIYMDFLTRRTNKDILDYLSDYSITGWGIMSPSLYACTNIALQSVRNFLPGVTFPMLIERDDTRVMFAQLTALKWSVNSSVNQRREVLDKTYDRVNEMTSKLLKLFMVKYKVEFNHIKNRMDDDFPNGSLCYNSTDGVPMPPNKYI